MTTVAQSWVEGANESHGFGLNHLPFGALEHKGAVRLCVRIGGLALDLQQLATQRLLPDFCDAELCAPTLNRFLAMGPVVWAEFREHLTALLHVSAKSNVQKKIREALVPLDKATLRLPLEVGGYTDFYASLHHARRVGELFRPDQPLLPNYKHIPIAYNGRASSVVVSGTPVRRPWGQRKPAHEGEPPTFAPTAALDYELELALVIGRANALGERIAIEQAEEAIFGVTLLNDWSARDVQAWEYQPLGPFLGKSFATSISPWITPWAALDPFRVPVAARETSDPRPLDYLWSDKNQQRGALDINVSASLSTERSRAATLPPMPLGAANTRDLYWTPAQMIAHHASNGCNLRPGDLLATGTISGPQREQAGCLLEVTRNGQQPLTLANDEQRAWLMDGDEVTLSARCERDALPSIVLGDCTGYIAPA
ncbi:MAG: fumarylacetoacetase [Acidobacteriota bacterium]